MRRRIVGTPLRRRAQLRGTRGSPARRGPWPGNAIPPWLDERFSVLSFEMAEQTDH
jgi:hypothetical protein